MIATLTPDTLPYMQDGKGIQSAAAVPVFTSYFTPCFVCFLHEYQRALYLAASRKVCSRVMQNNPVVFVLISRGIMWCVCVCDPDTSVSPPIRYMSQAKHAEARELMYNGALLFFSYNQVKTLRQSLFVSRVRGESQIIAALSGDFNNRKSSVYMCVIHK